MDVIAALGLRGMLAYTSQGIHVIDLATGRDTAVTEAGGQPALSPDGSRIAYARAAVADGLDSTLHVVGSDGRGAREIFSRTGAGLRAPAWSPDARRIAFAVHEQSADSWLDGRPDSNSPWDPAGVREIWVVDAGGTNAHRIDAIPRERYASDPAWSPDGQRLAFSNRAVSVLDLASGRITEIARDSGGPAWSPDGRRIAVGRGVAIDIVRIDDHAVETRIESGRVPDATFGSRLEYSYSSPTWSPSGEWIAFRREDLAVDSTADDDAICIVRPDGRDLTVLVSGPAYDPSWSI